MKWAIKMLWGFLLAVFLIGVPKIGGWIASLLDQSKIDPDGAFMWISIHHIVQMLVVFIVMIVLTKIFKIDFKLGLGHKEKGIKLTKWFIFGFTLYTVIAFGITIILGAFQSFPYPLNARNITGYLGFQLLLSGPSEELIFRAFSMTMFMVLIKSNKHFKHISSANLYAAVIFMLAHVGFSLLPLSISYSLPQLVLSFVLGLFYGYAYEKTESVVYPMIWHSFSNVMMVGLTVVLSYIL